ncbi:MAG: hypothetical protein Kow0092_25790 [Deferrisomatales bacterium]
MTILVVDDDRVSRAVLRRILENLGHRVEEAPDAMAALEAVAVAPPDLVITDWVMPGMGGAELIGTLRASGFDGPVWFTVPRSDPDPAAGLAAGGQASVRKPFEPNEIEAQLAQICDTG